MYIYTSYCRESLTILTTRSSGKKYVIEQQILHHLIGQNKLNLPPLFPCRNIEVTALNTSRHHSLDGRLLTLIQSIKFTFYICPANYQNLHENPQEIYQILFMSKYQGGGGGVAPPPQHPRSLLFNQYSVACKILKRLMFK